MVNLPVERKRVKAYYGRNLVARGKLAVRAAAERGSELWFEPEVEMDRVI
jgi:hypothetical protein